MGNVMLYSELGHCSFETRCNGTACKRHGCCSPDGQGLTKLAEQRCNGPSGHIFQENVEVLLSPLCPLQGNDNFNASNRKQPHLLLELLLQLSRAAGAPIYSAVIYGALPFAQCGCGCCVETLDSLFGSEMRKQWHQEMYHHVRHRCYAGRITLSQCSLTRYRTMLAWCSCFSTLTSASTLRTCTATGAATACSLLILICDTAQLRSRCLSW